MRVIYLQPKSPYFSNKLPSDSLFNSIMWAILVLYGENKVKEILDSFNTDDPLIKISSCFPYRIINGERKLFLPKPVIPFSKNQQTDSKEAAQLKKFKKLKYFEFHKWMQIINGEISYLDLFKQQEIWNGWASTFIEETEILQNSLDRLTNSTSYGNSVGGLFFTSNHYIQNGGLFFLSKSKVTEYLEAALAFLSHKGFGGDANTGRGIFDIEIDNNKLKDFKETVSPNSFITLSLYSPKQDEVDFYNVNEDKVFYDLTYRKGLIGGSYMKLKNPWKKPVLMFSEGSVFPNLNKPHYGQNLIVNDETNGVPFNVIQYGIAFNIGTILQ